MCAQDAARRGETQPVEHSLRVAPGDTHLRREAEPLRFVGKDFDNLFELVEFDGVELAVAVGGVDAVHAGGMETPHILAQDAFVEAVVIIKGRCDRGPDAVQVGACQAVAHVHARLLGHVRLTPFNVNSRARWQRTKWPGSISSCKGVVVRQTSTAYWQRGWK